jgi:hypothetical protein
MKRLIIIFLLLPTIGFSQTIVNNNLLLTNFKKILNDYRWMHRLNPVEIDKNLKGFTDNWAKEMGEMGGVQKWTLEKVKKIASDFETKVDFLQVYPYFGKWAESSGFSSEDWYENKKGYRDEDKMYIEK